jgi:hypothetical protein
MYALLVPVETTNWIEQPLKACNDGDLIHQLADGEMFPEPLPSR